MSRSDTSPAKTRPSGNSYGSQAEVGRPEYSTTLNAMSPTERSEALHDFTRYFKYINKDNPVTGIRDADPDRIEREFDKFYAILDALKVTNPKMYRSEMGEYKEIIRKANSCLGSGCVVSGGKSRKSRKSIKSRKHKQSKKRRKHKKHNKSRKH
jgi:hypothetical protein